MFQPGDALIVIDVQVDFVAGSLAVPGAWVILPKINDLVLQAVQAKCRVHFTKCWHPPNHCSFKGYGGIWPAHCVQRTRGAQIMSEVIQGIEFGQAWEVHKKGMDPLLEAYSGFDSDTLATSLWTQNTNRVVLCGLATDYCVRATALAARKLGYQTTVVENAIRAVNLKVFDGEDAVDEMIQAGCVVESWGGKSL